MREAATICPVPCKLAFDLLILKVVSESRMTWANCVPILVFLGLSVLDLGPMYATDIQTSDAHHRLMPPLRGREHNNVFVECFNYGPIFEHLYFTKTGSTIYTR